MNGAAPAWPRPVYVAGIGVAVPPLSPAQEPCEKRQRKLMSRAAYLGAAAVKAALTSAGWTGSSDVGLFMGVGASGGEMSELEAMLGPSLDATGLDLGRFGTTGLGAANPLFAFQLMNNFTLCHGAILSGLEGPNARLLLARRRHGDGAARGGLRDRRGRHARARWPAAPTRRCTR